MKFPRLSFPRHDSCIWDALAGALLIVGVLSTNSVAVLGAFCSWAVVILFVRWLPVLADAMDISDPFDVSEDDEQPEMPVDPWSYQRDLMKRSDQRMPPTPRMTTNALLYGALIMEESGETFIGLVNALRAHRMPTPLEGLIACSFNGAAHDLISISKSIRENLKNVEVDFPLSLEQAVELLDGHADLTVVNCGFALALGLPGAAGYDEVGSSNLSKVNPATGRIEKDPSGKWIKGPQYFKPDLARVLSQHVER